MGRAGQRGGAACKGDVGAGVGRAKGLDQGGEVEWRRGGRWGGWGKGEKRHQGER